MVTKKVKTYKIDYELHYDIKRQEAIKVYAWNKEHVGRAVEDWFDWGIRSYDKDPILKMLKFNKGSDSFFETIDYTITGPVGDKNTIYGLGLLPTPTEYQVAFTWRDDCVIKKQIIVSNSTFIDRIALEEAILKEERARNKKMSITWIYVTKVPNNYYYGTNRKLNIVNIIDKSPVEVGSAVKIVQQTPAALSTTTGPNTL